MCGVVKNVGEPGGGPFLAYNADGTVSLQILESSQIDKDNPEYVAMEIPNDFIVGFGLDYNEIGRNLKDIYVLDPEA